MTLNHRAFSLKKISGKTTLTALAAWLACGALAGALSLDAGLPARAASAARQPNFITLKQTFELALEARTTRDHGEMLSLLRQAAEAGELAAQKVLADVLLTSRSLYGEAVPANPCEVAH